jgi:uncharacterized membrane protein
MPIIYGNLIVTGQTISCNLKTIKHSEVPKNEQVIDNLTYPLPKSIWNNFKSVINYLNFFSTKSENIQFENLYLYNQTDKSTVTINCDLHVYTLYTVEM